MPALPNVPSVIRIDHFFKIGEDLNAKCRLFVSYTGTAPTSAMLTTAAASAETSFGTNVCPEMSTDRSLVELKMTDLTTATSGVGLWTGSQPGTAAGALLPASACLLESMTIARRYRGGHPRVYWPFGTQSALSDAQTWTAGFTGSVATALTNYRTTVLGLTWAGGGVSAEVNVSYYSGFTTHTGTTGRYRNVATVRLAPLIDTVVGHVYRGGVAQQRKRLLRLA